MGARALPAARHRATGWCGPTTASGRSSSWRAAGACIALPDGFQLLAPTQLSRRSSGPACFSWPGKLRMALDLALPRGTSDDESLGGFVRRRLGHEALERVAQPLVAGIYTADPDDLSLAATMPRFSELERRERVVILALWRAAPPGRRSRARAARAGASSSPLRDGMEELVTATLAAPARRARCVSRSVSTAIERRVATTWRVVGGLGPALEADRVIVAAGVAHRARDSCATSIPALAHPARARSPTASSATVTLGLPSRRRPASARRVRLRSFQAPEAPPIIACTFSSVKYPGPRARGPRAAPRASSGGALNEGDRSSRDDRGLIAAAAGRAARGARNCRRAGAGARRALDERRCRSITSAIGARVEAIEQCAAAPPGPSSGRWRVPRRRHRRLRQVRRSGRRASLRRHTAATVPSLVARRSAPAKYSPARRRAPRACARRRDTARRRADFTGRLST